MIKRFIQLGILVFAFAVSQTISAAQYAAGDLAPRGVGDGQINVGDLVVLTRIIHGLETASTTEQIVGDVGPLGSAPDGVLDVRDVLILQRVINGQLPSLGTITIPPPAPELTTIPPSTTTTLNPYQITGTTTTPLTNVDIYVNGSLQQQTISDPSGVIDINVDLFDGLNSIYATASDADSTSVASNTVQVTYNNTISRTQSNTTISTNTVWTPGLTPLPYVITSNLTVASGVSFVIQPGTVLQFDSGVQLAINGRLEVRGTSLNPVTFTSITASPGSWAGLKINAGSTNSVIDYAVIEYASTGIEVKSGSINTNINNSFIQNNSSFGVYFNGANGVANNNNISGSSRGIFIFNAAPQISNNKINNNTNGIYLINASSDIISNTIINNLGTGIYMWKSSSPIINSGNVITGNGSGLFLQGGSGNNPQPLINNNEIHSNTSWNVSSGGYTQGESIVIDASSNWWGTTIVGDIAAFINDYADTNSSSNPIIDFNGFLDSVGGNPVSVNILPLTITANTTLTTGTVYQAIGNVTINSGVTLFIEPGAILHFGSSMALIVNGSVQVNGTQSNPVRFTSQSILPSSGDWQGFILNSTSTNSVFDWAVIEYARTGIFISGASNTIITNSNIQNNLVNGINIINAGGMISNNNINNNSNGISLENASPQISANLITNNTSNGIYIFSASDPIINLGNVITNNGTGVFLQSGGSLASNNPQPIINNNEIYANTIYNVNSGDFFEGESVVIDATGNWWGTSVISDISASIVGNSVGNIFITRPFIDFNGFLDAPNGNPVQGNYLPIFITADTTLVGGVPYQALSDVIVQPGVTLTIQQGAVLLFGSSMDLIVKGNMQINGVQSNPVLFSSQSTVPAIGDWSGIVIESTAGSVLIDHALIQFATYGVHFNNASGTVTNSILTNNQYGLYISGSSNPIIDSNILASNSYGIWVDATTGIPQPSIINNDIYNNAMANLLLSSIDTSTVLNFSNNWWGTNVVTDIRNTISGANQTTSVLLDSVAAQENQTSIPFDLVTSEKYISPASSIGIQDTVNIAATFNQIENWTVDVKNSANQNIRSLSSGTGTAINITWDGKDNSSQVVMDGRYLIVVSVNGRFVAYQPVFVDNLLPTPSFVDGLNGTTISSSSLIINGTATDLHFSNYRVEHGVGSSPTSWTTIDALKIIPVFSGELVNWLITSSDGSIVPLNGINTIRLTVTDLAGNSNTQQIQVTVNALAIYGVSSDVVTINPSNGELVNISFEITKPATVYLRFYPEQDSTISNMMAEVSQTFITPGSKTMSWNGMGADNIYLSDEAYRFELTAEDGANSFLFSRTDAYTNTEICFFNGISGYFNPGENKYIKFTCPPSQPARVSFISSSSADNNVLRVNKPVDIGTHSFTWDQRDSDGKLLDQFIFSLDPTLDPLRKDAVIINGNNPVIVGTGSTPNIEVVATPYTVLHSFEQISKIVYRLDQDANISVRLLKPCASSETNCTVNHDDPAGFTIFNGALSAKDGSNQVIDHSFEWRGYDFNAEVVDTNNILVSDDGFYTFSIKATSVVSGLSTTYRGSIYLGH